MREVNSSAKRLDNLRASAKRWGWPRALWNVSIKGAARYLGVHIYVIRIRPISAKPKYPVTNPDVMFRKIELDELLRASEDPALSLDPGFITNAIARGDMAFGAFDGPLLVSYIWRSVESAPDTGGVWVRVGKPYNYSYKSYTRPDYRGQRISPVVHLFSDNEMRKLGYKYRVGFISLTNYSSLGMGKHMESRKIGHAGYIEWFDRVTSFRTREVKKTGFEFFRPKEPN